MQLFSLDQPLLEPLPFAPYQEGTFAASQCLYGRQLNCLFISEFGNESQGACWKWLPGTIALRALRNVLWKLWLLHLWRSPAASGSVDCFDAGIDQSLLNNRLRFSSTWFYTRLQEVIVFDFSGAISPATDPFGRFGGYRNTNGGLARGFEFSVEAAASRSLDLSAATLTPTPISGCRWCQASSVLLQFPIISFRWSRPTPWAARLCKL